MDALFLHVAVYSPTSDILRQDPSLTDKCAVMFVFVLPGAARICILTKKSCLLIVIKGNYWR